MKYAIGVDLGGTNIKAVAVADSGEILHKCTAETKDEPNGSSSKTPLWATEIKNLIATLKSELESVPSVLGLCAPGLASDDGKRIAFMPGRLFGLEGFDWSSYLGENVYVLDDAKAALLGEVWIGSAAGCQNVIMLTLGTGVGGAIYADGKLLKGHIGRAGNLGHISLNVDLPCDVSGMPGSLENSIGECTVKQRCDSKFSSTKELVEAANGGDEFALKVWRRSVYQLACGVASLINVVDPEIVLIGGGIAKAGDALFKPLEEYLDKIEWRPSGESVKIIPASLGEWAGALGAARNAIMESK